MSVEHAILVCNAAATGVMCGVIWLVQLVHYPLFARYDPQHFRAAMADHQRGTTRVVLVPMLAELLSSVALLAVRPDGAPAWAVWIGAGLVGVWGFSTVLVQVPLHEKLLAGGFDAGTHRRLVRSNWVRTAAWTVRAVLCAGMLLAAKP